MKLSFQLITLVTYFISIPTFAQSSRNIVPNGDFELYTQCPNSVGKITDATGWYAMPEHNGSGDYFNKCASYPLVSVPENYWGQQMAASGNGYVGLNLIYFDKKNFREYIEIQLTEAMVRGDLYKVTFKYSLADNSTDATDAFGLYFSDTEIRGNNTVFPVNVTPQIVMDSVVSNKNVWKQQTIMYRATGAERFLTFGNFKCDTLTYTSKIDSTASFNGAYLYIDDVSVEPQCMLTVLEPDQILCPNQTIRLDAAVTDATATYQWNDNSTSPVFTITQPGTYWVNVTVNNCTKTDSIVIYDLPDIGTDTTLCPGEHILLDATVIPAAAYMWKDSSTVTPTFEVQNAGTYWVHIMLDKCTITDTIAVKYTYMPRVRLSADREICIGETIELNAYDKAYDNYLWSDYSTAPVYTVKKPGKYWVTQQSGRCYRSDTIEIIKSKACEVALDMPNVFTPNGDGTNDYFLPSEMEGIVQVQIFIYNRWGQLVFQSNNMKQGWNGNINEEQSTEGLYYWYLNGTTIYDKEIALNGTLSLLR